MKAIKTILRYLFYVTLQSHIVWGVAGAKWWALPPLVNGMWFILWLSLAVNILLFVAVAIVPRSVIKGPLPRYRADSVFRWGNIIAAQGLLVWYGWWGPLALYNLSQFTGLFIRTYWDSVVEERQEDINDC